MTHNQMIDEEGKRHLLNELKRQINWPFESHVCEQLVKTKKKLTLVLEAPTGMREQARRVAIDRIMKTHNLSISDCNESKIRFDWRCKLSGIPIRILFDHYGLCTITLRLGKLSNQKRAAEALRNIFSIGNYPGPVETETAAPPLNIVRANLETLRQLITTHSEGVFSTGDDELVYELNRHKYTSLAQAIQLFFPSDLDFELEPAEEKYTETFRCKLRGIKFRLSFETDSIMPRSMMHVTLRGFSKRRLTF